MLLIQIYLPLKQSVDAGVTIDSIAITDAADTKLDALALATGGYAFLYSVRDNSNALNDAFNTIGERNLGMSCHGSNIKKRRICI